MNAFDLPQMYRWSGVLLVAIAGLIHLVEAPEYFGDAIYVGVLFLANVGGALVAAFGISRGAQWGWLLGFLVAGGAFAAYILSRTVGLPRFTGEVGQWSSDPFGILSLIVEALFVILFLVVITRRAAAS